MNIKAIVSQEIQVGKVKQLSESSFSENISGECQWT